MTNSPATIEFWFDFASTYSYPAAIRIEELAASHSRIVEWRPFLLGAIFQKQGWHDSPFNIYPAKGRYMWRDLERLCASLNIPYRKPSHFPRNGLAAARVVCANQGAVWIAQFVRRVFAANFASDLDIAQPKVLLDCLEPLVNDPVSVLTAGGTSEAKSRLRHNTQRAEELGIFGAPSFVVVDELFWGNDRMETALKWRVGGQE
jgi:2-hydroxychromene-2-carboxylate isomerase